jgi:hypothetical protein
MAEESDKNSTMTEEKVVAKVAELMETLDQIKKYGVLARHLKMFSLIVIGSIVICIFVNLFNFLRGAFKRIR